MQIAAFQSRMPAIAKTVSDASLLTVSYPPNETYECLYSDRAATGMNRIYQPNPAKPTPLNQAQRLFIYN